MFYLDLPVTCWLYFSLISTRSDSVIVVPYFHTLPPMSSWFITKWSQTSFLPRRLHPPQFYISLNFTVRLWELEKYVICPSVTTSLVSLLCLKNKIFRSRRPLTLTLEPSVKKRTCHIPVPDSSLRYSSLHSFQSETALSVSSGTHFIGVTHRKKK